MTNNFIKDFVMKNTSIKLMKIITYILLVILVALIFYDIYTLIQSKSSTRTPNNAINVSPITGEPLTVSNSNPALSKIDYDSHELNELPYIESADILLEQYNSNLNLVDYSAYFYNKTLKTKDGISTINNLNTNSFPKINFINDINFTRYSMTVPNSTIYIKYNDDNVTSFTFLNGYYRKFYGSSLDKFIPSNNDIKYSNVVVQYLNDNTSIDCFYKNNFMATLFTNGKCENFFWDGKSFIFNDKTSTSFLTGKTYWILMPKNTNYLYSN